MDLRFTIRRMTITAVVGVLIGAPLAKVAAQENTPDIQVIDKIVAKVDDYAILKSEVEQGYLDLLSRGEARGEEDKCEILQVLVTQKMLLAQAEIDSIEVGEVEVDFELDRRMSYFIGQFGGSEEELEAFYGKPLEQIQEEIRGDVRDQMVIGRMQEQITEEVNVTPSEVRKFYNGIPEDSLPYYSEEVSVAQIVKKAEVSKAQKLETERFLLDLRQQIIDGADFGELAIKYSQDPGSASNGGEYANFIKRGQFVPEFEAAAFKLKVGDLSGAVETEYGFHLIQLLDRRGNEYRVRHILLVPRITAEDMNRARMELDSIKNVIVVDKTPFETIAKEYSDEKFTGQNGGYFTDASGADRIPLEQLDPTLYFSLDTMAVGTISEPVEFTLPDGKQAVRLIYYKSKYRPHQANLKDDWQKIHSAALNEKKTKAQNDWFEKSKGNFFILIEPDYDCNILGRK